MAILNHFQITENDSDPKLICEECASELILVTKFHEKCKLATEALQRLKDGNDVRNPEEVSLSVEIVDNTSPESVHKDVNSIDSDTNAHPIMTKTEIEENVEYITADAYAEENYEYVIIDENVVRLSDGLSDLSPKVNDDDGDTIEDADDNFTVVTEYINAEEMDDTNNDVDIATSGTADDSFVGNVDIDASIQNQLHRARKKKIGFGSPKSSAKININHNCKICGAGFAQLPNLNRHMQTHAEASVDNVFTCGTCRSSFTEYVISSTGLCCIFRSFV